MYIIEGAFYLWKWYWDLQYCLFVCSSAYGTGGIGLAVISGIGLMLYTFVFHYKPGTPPIGVMLTILARRNLRGVFADFRRFHGHAEVCGKISPQ